MLSIAVHYLSRRVYAGRFDDSDKADWPPDPARLFFAAVSTLHATGNQSDGREALLWLERQSAPAMWFSDALERDGMSAYVPRNDAASLGVLEEQRRKLRAFPSVQPDTPIVYYIWADADPSPEIRQSLCDLLNRITYLGHSSSLVSVTLCDNPPAPKWEPSFTGDLALRIVGSGTLVELESIHQRYVETVALGARLTSGKAKKWEPSRPQLPAAFAHYARVRPSIREREQERGEFTEMLVLGFPPGCPLPVISTLGVTRALRGAAMANARPLPVEALSGHSGDGQQTRHDHAAFLTLPDVGHDYADGHLLGVAVALPRLDAAVRGAVLRPIAAVRQLRLGRAGAWSVSGTRPGYRMRRGLYADVWTRPSRRWASVTPVAMYPRQRKMTQEHIAIACRHSGLPEPEGIVISDFSPLLGIPPSPAFAPIQLHQRQGTLWHRHVVLLFGQPVQGPVIIGAGRYRGYGLCRPLEAA